MEIKKFAKLSKSEFKRITHQMVSKGYIICKLEKQDKGYMVEYCREVL